MITSAARSGGRRPCPVAGWRRHRPEPAPAISRVVSFDQPSVRHPTGKPSMSRRELRRWNSNAHTCTAPGSASSTGDHPAAMPIRVPTPVTESSVLGGYCLVLPGLLNVLRDLFAMPALVDGSSCAYTQLDGQESSCPAVIASTCIDRDLQLPRANSQPNSPHRGTLSGCPGRRGEMSRPSRPIQRTAQALAVLMGAWLVVIPMTVTSASAPAPVPTFSEFGSAKQVYVTGLAPFAPM